MVGIEAIAQVGGKSNEQLRARASQSLCYGTPAIRTLPGPLGAPQERHGIKLEGLMHDMLPIIEAPIFGQDTSLGFEPLIERCGGKWRQNGITR